MKIRMSVAAMIAVALVACAERSEEPVLTEPPDAAEVASETIETATATEEAVDTFRMPEDLQTTASGLQYSIEREGQGAQPQTGQTVSVHYSGWLTDGTPFDSSRGRGPLEFPIGQGRVIQGWEEGVAAMKPGEVRWLVIPPDLGYGDQGSSGVIPPGATLVFRVELIGAR